MSTLAVTAINIAGQVATDVATAAALSTANTLISNAFDNRVFEGPRLEGFQLQTSRDGAPMSRIYGRMRLAGQVIWASRLRETRSEEDVQSGKGGGPTRVNYSYSMSFAIGLCEGEILGVDRLWANGQALPTAGLNMRVYKGTADQHADPIISAIEGADVPAFRDTAYIVFEDFPLDGFGGRLPQINAEVIRIPPSNGDDGPKLETLIKSVNLLPASGEFAYATEVVEETPEPGMSRPINMNNISGQADILKSLDQLEDQLPNCRHVSIITAWFGTDLRCDHCEIVPGVERRERTLPETQWQVGSDTRGQAYLISADSEGRPNYGGTPSDASIIQAIKELKRRGFKVTLYPFILMDIPNGNALPDPYGGNTQAAFPWRGRIAGEEGGVAPSQIATFFNRPKGFRNYILHYAQLAKAAGGVEGFVMGSEMRGLTTLRGPRVNGQSTYPTVSYLVDLAADIRSVLGPDTSLTYAADWSEYFGHHPQDGSGDVSFHLDPLWASEHISAIGIDAYFPLSDWREGDHLDANDFDDIYDLNYLRSQIEGGEGYDYFYSSEADRDAQIRTAITDGEAQKPWVFRYKDLRHFWSERHYNRVGGVEVETPTEWMPESKPIQLLEIGCPAVKFGANQPNVFFDAKSSESKLPYYSDGYRDDFMQRCYLEALISYWDNDANNPASTLYSGRMIDTDHVSVWAWDARPFPDFPARDSVWSDGENWQRGHWISGRLGLVPLADIVRDIAAQSGLTNIDTTQLNGLVQGYHIERPMSARAAIATLSELFGFSLAERNGTVAFFSLGQGGVSALEDRQIVEDSPATITRHHPDPALKFRDVRLHFINAGNDYQLGLASARDRLAETERIIDVSAPIVMDNSFADYLCESLLERSQSQTEIVQFSLSLQALTLEVGDRVQLPNTDGIWRIEMVDSGNILRVQAKRDRAAPIDAMRGATPDTASDILWPGRPVPIELNLPAPFVGLAVGALLDPFVETTLGVLDTGVVVQQPLRMGALLTSLPPGPTTYFDRNATFEVLMGGPGLNRKDEAAVLAGANRFAVETPQGWDILQAADITLIGPNHYRFETILRGVGSEGYSKAGVAAGARVIWLDAGVKSLPLSAELIGETWPLTAIAAGRESLPISFIYEGADLKPLSPVHLAAKQIGTDTHLAWIRRSRIDADSWVGEVPLGEAEERYRLRLWDDEVLLEEVIVSNPEYVTPRTNITHFDVAQGSDFVGWGEVAAYQFSLV